MRWIGVLIYIFIAVSAQGAAKNCTSVDIRLYQSPTMQSYFATVRNQRDTGWCYAFAASDLLSDRLQRPVSAFAVAYDYNSKLTAFDHFLRKVNQAVGPDKEYFPDGGWIEIALKQVLANHILCSESEAPSEVNSVSAKKSFLSWSSDFEHQSLKTSTLRGLFPRLTQQQAGALLTQTYSSHSSLFEVMYESSQVSCTLIITPAHISLANANNSDIEPLDFIDGALDQNRPRPAAILIHSNLVFKEDDSSFFEKLLGDHYSVVIGRQIHGADCEYLIRDSFGKDCSQYRTEGIRCNGDGTYWIQKDLLMDITEDATTLR